MFLYIIFSLSFISGYFFKFVLTSPLIVIWNHIYMYFLNLYGILLLQFNYIVSEIIYSMEHSLSVLRLVLFLRMWFQYTLVLVCPYSLILTISGYSARFPASSTCINLPVDLLLRSWPVLLPTCAVSQLAQQVFQNLNPPSNSAQTMSDGSWCIHTPHLPCCMWENSVVHFCTGSHSSSAGTSSVYPH